MRVIQIHRLVVLDGTRGNPARWVTDGKISEMAVHGLARKMMSDYWNQPPTLSQKNNSMTFLETFFVAFL